MQAYQKQFVDLIFETTSESVLRFGNFVLKSGRKSPYFFQAGNLNKGHQLAQIGHCLAALIKHHKLHFDGLFGPAYKGIPLVSATAIALAQEYKLNYPCSFNRKLAKDHGEGGLVVGAGLKNDILIIDDVLTAGTAINQAIELIQQQGATISGVATLLDRCEKSIGNQSTSQWIEQKHQVPVISVISIYDILQKLRQTRQTLLVNAIENHLQVHGA